jgi:hypothetical protein
MNTTIFESPYGTYVISRKENIREHQDLLSIKGPVNRRSDEPDADSSTLSILAADWSPVALSVHNSTPFLWTLHTLVELGLKNNPSRVVYEINDSSDEITTIDRIGNSWVIVCELSVRLFTKDWTYRDTFDIGEVIVKLDVTDYGLILTDFQGRRWDISIDPESEMFVRNPSNHMKS